jgi:hypothetical protein
MAIIIPEYKVIFTYDIRQDVQSQYMQFMLSEFIPGLQSLGLYVTGVYHTVYGNYPDRLTEFVSERKEGIMQLMEHESFQVLEDQLKQYTQNYTRKLVPFSNRFQF